MTDDSTRDESTTENTSDDVTRDDSVTREVDGDTVQHRPIMSGADEASEDEKADGRDAQERADAAFYEGKDKTNAGQPDPEPSESVYVNPSSSSLSHQKD
ncbi:hypothetical protein [Herbiconiux solani]|uniref:hypothetical protein n=1 Tax=Herbiconiux solani TaxID=661329 RepID=UPI00082617D5|nr:hypothetical protein [Herbiconiux solani]